MLKILCTSVAALILMSGQVSAAGDPAAGEKKSQVCIACHGPGGNSVNPAWPNLAGQHEEYLRKQLSEFRAGTRKNPQMSPMAAALSDEDIDDLAAYFSTQEKTVGEADPEGLDEAEMIYRAGNKKSELAACIACHGPNGAGNPAANYPVLSGQHAAYTANTLKEFKAETRDNDTNAVMRSIARKMTNDEIEKVANYIQGLH